MEKLSHMNQLKFVVIHPGDGTLENGGGMKEAVGRRSWDVVEKEMTNLSDFSKSVHSFIDSLFLSFLVFAYSSMRQI